jgi:hypothetical protein
VLISIHLTMSEHAARSSERQGGRAKRAASSSLSFPPATHIQRGGGVVLVVA